MSLLGERVKHQVFGEGKIVSVTKNYVTVSFEIGEKVFVYPDAFEKFLTLVNQELSSKMEAYFKQREEQKPKQQGPEYKAEAKPEPKPEPKPKRKSTASPKKQKKARLRLNIAFKCNYCDGGKSEESIGFRGVCSDAMIDYNIETERHVWCSSAECPCKSYYDGKLTRAQLEDYLNQQGSGGFVCYESVMLRDWRAAAGIVQHGKNKGKPMRLMQVQPNSLAVLTTREPKTPESKRIIFAVFLVDDTYEGDNRDEGYVSAESEYRIELSMAEAKRLKFWNYYYNPNAPRLIKFGSGLHRYLSDLQAVQILRDIAAVKEGTKKEALAKKFFQHFCRTNRIEKDSLPEPDGALVRIRNKEQD